MGWYQLKLSKKLLRKMECGGSDVAAGLHFPSKQHFSKLPSQVGFPKQISLNGERGCKPVGVNMKTSMMGKAVCWEPHNLLDSSMSPVCLHESQELQTGFSHFISLNTSIYEHFIDACVTVSSLVTYK